MTASLTDLLSAAKNIAQAINDAARAYVGVQGSQVSEAITANTLVVSGAGRIAMLSVVVAGSGTGGIFDAASIAGSSLTTNFMASIPMSVGFYFVNLPFNNGLVVQPGTGQKVTISYSTGSASGDQTASSSGRQLRGF